MIGQRPNTSEIDPRDFYDTPPHETIVQRTAEKRSDVYHHMAPTQPRKRVNVSRNTKGIYTWEFTIESVGQTDAEMGDAIVSLDAEIRRRLGQQVSASLPPGEDY